jgi:predicted CopG family antitoxin
MSTKRTVKLEPDVYDRVAAQKRDDETFSEAIERLIGSRGVSLLDLCDEDAEYDEERHRERLETLERTAEADQRESEERQERYDS